LPPRAPKRHYWARLGPDISAESTFGALLKPLFRQFHNGVLRSSHQIFSLVTGAVALGRRTSGRVVL
jgi:hypothetical protein